MDYSLGREGANMLQLHKWGPSEAQLNLSEFSEAFISPTRQLLLLLSYQCEALLLPLITGVSIDSNNSDTCFDESLQISQAVTSRLDSRDNSPSTSGSVMDFDNDSSIQRKLSEANRHPFVCDVNSLAWGVCGDSYDQHKDASFKELLFVCGKNGVTVHAFCHPDKTNNMNKPAPEGEFAQGRWMEWGPSATSAQTVEAQRPSSFCCEASGSVDKNRATNVGECPLTMREEVGDDDVPGNVTSKRWLQSFLINVEPVESDGKFWTRFPDKSSFPSSAKVVSFSIFGFLSPGNSSSNKRGSWQETVMDSVNDAPIIYDFNSSSIKPNALSNFLGIGVNHLYRCTKVFSSNSHQWVGFVLTLMDLVSVDNESETGRRKNLLLVARLDSWGIQWVSYVKLEESLDMGLVFEWMDFQFSDDLLVCLNASGSIFFYSAMSGEYVAQLDILRTCGLGPQSNVQEQEKLIVADIENKQVDDFHAKPTHSCGDSSGKKLFRRLIVASYTSFLAAVDKYGVVYVICASDHVPEKYYSSKLPRFQNLGLGILLGWEVGGCEIGHQRVFSKFSGCYNSSISSIRNGCVSSNNIGSNDIQKLKERNYNGKRGRHNSYLSVFSAASKMMDQSFHGLELSSHRKVFLPTNRFNEDDCICFSPLGVTRFTRKHHIKDKKCSQIVHFDLLADSVIHDDGCLSYGHEISYVHGREESCVGEAVGCTFQGCFYLVTQGGLSVLLPAVSVSSNFLPIESIGYRQPSINTGIGHQVGHILEMKKSKQPWSPWKVEILDRVLLYEDPEVADHLCLENGWDLKISRTRRLQMALSYLQFDEVQQSLEMLVGLNLAEEGILRLLFAAVYLMFGKVGNDSELSAASRLLALASCFATKMIRQYGLLQHKKDANILQGFKGSPLLYLPPVIPDKVQEETDNSKRLCEMAHFLEIIRNLQFRLSEKYKRPGQALVDAGEASVLVDTNLSQDEFQLSILSADPISLDTPNDVSTFNTKNTEKLALTPVDSKAQMDLEDLSEAPTLVPQGGLLVKKVLPLENPREMIARWKMDKLDIKTVVKDALLSGRLPLAVLQLHLHHYKDLVTEEEPHDTFSEVRDIGRAIAYDLFLKGETGLAVATLQRLGEDIETCLKQLLIGTVRRSLRMQIAEEMKRYGYLGPYEWKMLERISLIERLYPSSSFWKTFLDRQKEFVNDASSSNSAGGINLRLLHSNSFNNLIIECGEIDGVVLGSWSNVNENSPAPVVDEDSAQAGYWAAAAVWSSIWDQRTIDRIVLDQPFLMGVHVLWESHLEYYICHNNWEEIFKLLDLIPTSVLSDGSLQISLDGVQPASIGGCNREFSDHGNYLCSHEQLDAVYMDIPEIKIFRFSSHLMCSMWLKTLIEQELAKKFIFLKEYWEGTAEIVPLLARSGFITSRYLIPCEDDSIETSLDLNFSNGCGSSNADSMQALRKLLIHHCVQYNLPNLLDLYLDHHNLILDNDSLCSLKEAAVSFLISSECYVLSDGSTLIFNI